MPKLTGVTIKEFIGQLNIARESHLARQEPIPELSQENIYNIETCLKTPFQTFSGKQLYKGFSKKAAILFYLLIKNHPLPNGNKRMAVLTLVYFCSKNGRNFQVDENKLYKLALDTANSSEKNQILPVIENLIETSIHKG